MSTPIDTQRLVRSPSPGRKAPQEECAGTFPSTEKYTRLEDLLRQTLRLAGEIAENVSEQRPSHIPTTGGSHVYVPGECIVLRKTSRAVSEPTLGLCRQSSTSQPRRRLRPSDSSEQDSTSPSAASSMQEPFSPGSLAMSLDAIVEGKRSDNPLVENSSFIADRLPESSPLTRATTSHAPASPQCPTPGSTLGQDSMSQSATSAPIPIPGPPRRQLSTSRRASSPGRGSGEDAPSPPPKWHVRIVPISLKCEPILSSSPPKTPAMPAFVKLEAVFPYRFFSDGHAAARWSGEGSYIIIGRSTEEDEGQSPLDLDECEHEFVPATGRSLRDFIEDWEGAVDELGDTEERKSFHAV